MIYTCNYLEGLLLSTSTLSFPSDILQYNVIYSLFRGLIMSPVLPVDGKHQGQGGDGLLSTRQIVHGHEAFPRRHAVVVDAAEVRLVWILCTQNGLEWSTYSSL